MVLDSLVDNGVGDAITGGFRHGRNGRRGGFARVCHEGHTFTTVAKFLLPIRSRPMTRIVGFPPLATRQSSVLILGSMPGVASLQAGRYYAHGRNAFWPIMGELFAAGPSLPYEDRVAVLLSHRVAVWDTLKACDRTGSLDTAIANEVPNDFQAFFNEHPGITHIFFNGAKAHAAYRRHILSQLPQKPHVTTILPSTSPAHAGRTFRQKVAAWSVVKQAAG